MTKAVSPRVVPLFFATTSNHKRDCCTKAICFVAFGIRARSRTRVRSLRPHPQRLASHPSCKVSAHFSKCARIALRATFTNYAKM